MIKFWTFKNNKNIDIVLIDDSKIFKGKIKFEALNNFSKQVENNKIPEGLFSIPFSYISKIENQKGKKDIKIYFSGDSEEELISKDSETKNEIFNYLREAISNMSYSKKTPSFFKYVKPQLFAIFFTTVIFIWSLYYAIQIENGVEYYLEGRAGLLSLIFSIGLLGVVKVIILFTLLIGIGVYSMIRKNKSRSEIEQLNR
ncbi:hypothetical protein [Polaribacter sp. Hel1_85]|uniref:hypothetical protein n=1 Tax=Polaribacter sp. Hel1_85 TaxID=1250005 RepID=UPI00052DBF84|nr:hypothetical protein [Polaribacter sp. Hel1_85]KGL62725.1 hypothetical protein PHEL85_2519 [Polaribacter sp. Hel1_85]